MTSRSSALGVAVVVATFGCTQGRNSDTNAQRPETAGSSESGAPTEGTPSGGPEVEVSNVDKLRAHIAELVARPELKGVAEVQVQHLLVSFEGAGTGATRSKSEAESLAADLWQRIQDGEDFDKLVKEATDDSHPGVYTMTASTERAEGKYPRSGMVPAFGNVGWRLEVGQFGVAGFDPTTSPYGWHIIQRRR